MSAVRFEKETCGRCGGSGRHSYNAMHGDVCYGCGGTGSRLSRRGRAARAKFVARKAEVLGRSARELRAGDRVWQDSSPGCGPIRATRSGWATVEAVSPSASARSRTGDGPWVEREMIKLKFPGLTRIVSADDVVLVWDSAKWADLLDFSRTLSGAEVTG